jgi:RNase adaptor protein for sRNA GlmZ degradation
MTFTIQPPGQQCRLISFGAGHGRVPPSVLLTFDARGLLDDPARTLPPEFRQLTGLDAEIAAHVMASPGARGLVAGAVATVLAVLFDAPGRVPTVGWCCTGGRHRSVALAEKCASDLRMAGLVVDVEHRDIDLPVLA